MSENPNLGVDLYGLWSAGKDNYPSVAHQIVAASSAIERTETGLPYAFMRPAVFGGGPYGPVYQRWRDLRDELLRVLNQTSSNLVDTGEALCQAVTHYRQVDAEADAAFKAILMTRGEPSPSSS